MCKIIGQAKVRNVELDEDEKPGDDNRRTCCLAL